MQTISSDPQKGSSAENQSGAGSSNEANGHSKPSEPGMTPGIGQAAENAGDEKNEKRNADPDEGNAESDKEKADLEQQYKETLTERD
jgi:hypothetical protein